MKIKNKHDALRWLRLYTGSVLEDVRIFSEDPTGYKAKEHFEDAIAVLEEMTKIYDWLKQEFDNGK